MSKTIAPIRVAVICDFLEEHWTSMDLVADMLLADLKATHSQVVAADRICPAMTSLFGPQPSQGHRLVETMERGYNRYWKYPRTVSKISSSFELLHIVDHSYSHLIHRMRGRPAVVTCHDLDAFHCILDDSRGRGSLLYRRMARHVLSGFKKAIHVVCDSNTVMRELVEHGLVTQRRASVVPLGTHPSCSPNPDITADEEARSLLGPEEFTDILHVGSTIPRKRIDTLLGIIAEIRLLDSSIRLIRIGGSFTTQQRELMKDLGLDDRSVLSLPFLSRETLAAIYRRVALVLLPSESEGFGLPVAEALACGTAVLASDLAVLREVGGDAVTYCPVGNVTAWCQAVSELLNQRSTNPCLWNERKRNGLVQSANFSWSAYASAMVAVYSQAVAHSTESSE